MAERTTAAAGDEARVPGSWFRVPSRRTTGNQDPGTRNQEPGTRVRPAVRWTIPLVLLASLSIRDVATTEAHRTRQAAAPFAFDLVEWEVRQVAARFGTLIDALRGWQLAPTSADVATIRAYFALPSAARLGQRAEAEQAIE